MELAKYKVLVGHVFFRTTHGFFRKKTSNRESGRFPEHRTYRVTNLSRRRRIRSTSTKGSPLGGAHPHPEVGNKVRQLGCLLPKSFNTKISRNNNSIHIFQPAGLFASTQRKGQVCKEPGMTLKLLFRTGLLFCAASC